LLGFAAFAAFARRRRPAASRAPLAVIFALCVVGVATSAGYAVTIDTVPIGNPGNPADKRYDADGVGSVSYSFRMGHTEVTNEQYVEFLNAVAASDPFGLYHEAMGCETCWPGGIVRSGDDGSYIYAVKQPAVGQGPGGTDYAYENKPVAYVSWYDAIRFANWLHNGQGGSGSTEAGAYTLLGGTPVPSNAAAITRNPGARWWLPSADEWYKAAYYDADPGFYYDYPTSSDNPPEGVLPENDTGNSANVFGITGYPTGSLAFLHVDVGAYLLSASPNGTLDQGGNVAEWNETLYGTSERGLRGGSAIDFPGDLHASVAYSYDFGDAGVEFIGFRVGTIAVLPGDFNHDGNVDAADYVVWRKGLGTTHTQDDFEVWRANFGDTMGGGSSESSSASVPEPTSALLLMLGGALRIFRRRQIAWRVSLNR
jgi:formylglycine-generating enzyme required for sulfatase activity